MVQWFSDCNNYEVIMKKNTEQPSAKYSRLDLRYLCEHPADELEEAFAEEEANREADLILSRFASDSNFKRGVITKLAERELAARHHKTSNGILEASELNTDAQNPR